MGHFLQLLKYFNNITVIHNVFNNVILNKTISLAKIIKNAVGTFKRNCLN